MIIGVFLIPNDILQKPGEKVENGLHLKFMARWEWGNA